MRRRRWEWAELEVEIFQWRWEFVGVHVQSATLYRGCGALSKGFGDRGLPWELLCADDLVLLANSEEDLRRLWEWRSELGLG